MAEAEIISLAPEPKLRYFFVTTETKLGATLVYFNVFILIYHPNRWIFIGSLVKCDRRHAR